MDYAPPIAITPAINHLCVEIGTLVGSLERRVPPRNLLMVRHIHSAQVSSLIATQEGEDAEVEAAPREELERVLREAIRRLDDYDPSSVSDFMRLNTLLADALGVWDVWRTVDGVETPYSHVPCVPASHVRDCLEQLLDWYDRTDLHPLTASCVFRYECSIVRPFACASDLARRLWHHRMLTCWNPVFRWIDIEAALAERRPLVRAAVEESRRRINDAPYVTLVLGTIRDALKRLDDELDVMPDRSANVEQVLLYFGSHPASTISDASANLGIALRTCARYVSELQRDGRLKRIGSRKKGTWQVIG